MTDFAGSGSRRVFAERLLREVDARLTAFATSGGSLVPAITVLPLATSVAATDRFPLVTSAGLGYRATATLIRDYVLGISGGTATIPENLTVQGNTTLGNANTDTLTLTARVASDIVPTTTDAYRLGSASLGYLELWIQHNSSRASGLNLVQTLAGAGSPRLFFNNTTDSPGAANAIWQVGSNTLGFYTGGTPGSSSGTQRWFYNASGILPTTTNAMNLGSLSNVWANVFATRMTAPLFGTTTAADVVIDRNSVTQLTIGSLTATFAGSLAINGALSGVTTLATSGVNTLTNLAGVGSRMVVADATGALSTTAIPSGTGDVVGPASSTDNAVARFDLATGKLLQNSVVLIGDTGAVSGVTTASIGAGSGGNASLPIVDIIGGTASHTPSILLGSSTTDLTGKAASISIRAYNNTNLVVPILRMVTASTFNQLTVGTSYSAGVREALTNVLLLAYTSPTSTTLGAALSLSGSGSSVAVTTGDFRVDNGNATFNDNGGDNDFRIEGDTLTHAFLLDAGQDSLGLFGSAVPNFQTGRGIAYLANATTVPTGNPSGGGFLYSEGGALKWRGSGGTITTIALA